MKSFSARQFDVGGAGAAARNGRVALSFVVMLALSLASFGGVQLAGALDANAANCAPAECAPPAGTTTTTTRTVARERVTTATTVHRRVLRLPIRRVSRAQPTTTTTPRTTPTTPPTTTVALPPAPAVPATCAEVVAGIEWPPNWQVQCDGPRSGVLGITNPAGITDLFVRADETMSRLRVVALHEAGHAWDFARLDSARIAQWCAARGCDAAHFFTAATTAQGWSEPGGAEDWAASWDACHGGEYHRSYLGLPAPTAAQCALQDSLVGARG